MSSWPSLNKWPIILIDLLYVPTTSCLVSWQNQDPTLCQLDACTPAADHGWRNICDCTEWSYFKFMTTDSVSPWCCPAIILHFIHLHIFTLLDNNFTLTFLPSNLQHLLPYPHTLRWWACFPFHEEKWKNPQRTSTDSCTPPPHLLVSVSIDSASLAAITKEPLGSSFPICALDPIPLHTYLL